MLLFEDKIRTDLSIGKHLDNAFEFYDRSVLEEIEKKRQLLNSWFIHYPKEHQAQMKSDFKAAFDDTLFELYIHELFYKQGFELEVHPTLSGVSTRPDFLAIKGDCEIYIEAKNLRNISFEDERLERRLGAFYDGINAVGPWKFFLWLEEVTLKSELQPRAKPFLKYINERIEKYSGEEYASFSHEELKVETSFTYETDQILVKGALMPHLAPHGTELHLIGSYPGDIFWGEGKETIIGGLEKKLKKYGKPSKPFLICINMMNVKAAGELSADAVFWGSHQYSFSVDPKITDVILTRKNDGIYRDSRGPKSNHISGVMINRVSINNIPFSEGWLSKHPFSTNPLNFDCLELTYSYIEKEKIYTKEGLSMHEILAR